MEKVKTKILIIGGGPAGCMTSYELSNAAVDHVVIDKAVFPRDKICGDALSGKVIDALSESRPDFLTEFFDKDVFKASPGISFFGPNGKQLDIPFPKRKDQLDVGYVSTRKNFDNLLVEHLDARFCTFYQGIEVQEVTANKSVIIAVGEKNVEIEFDIIIGADGARSMVAEHFKGRIQDKNHHSAAIRAYYKNVTGFNSDFIELHFIKDLLPGYFWIFPLPNNDANVGLGMLSSEISKNKISLRKKLNEIVTKHPVLKERFKNAELVEDIKGWGLPLGSKKRQICGDSFMLIGDAAWLIDPFTGEGIGNALISGQLSAKWAVKAINDRNYSGDFFQGYQNEVYKKLWAELHLSHRLQKLSAKKWLFNFLINKALNNKKLRETMTTMFANVDVRAELKRPSFYIKLIFGN